MCFMEIFKNLAEKSLLFQLKAGGCTSWFLKVPSSLESVILSMDEEFCFQSSEIHFYTPQKMLLKVRLTFLKVNTVSFLLEDAIVQIMTLPLTLTVASGVECQAKMRDCVLVKNRIKNPLTPHQHLTGWTYLPFQRVLKDRHRINETVTEQFKFFFCF